MLKVGRAHDALTDVLYCEAAAPDDEWVFMRKGYVNTSTHVRTHISSGDNVQMNAAI